jgi:hypothetical protein
VPAAAPHETLLFFDKEIDGVPATDITAMCRFCWPLPYDKPGTLPGRQTAAYVYTDPKTGRSANLLDAGAMLYDLRNDAAESYNVADRHPEETRRLEALAAGWEPLPANPRGWR